MPSLALTPVEENAARRAFEMLQKKKLLKVKTGRGRPPGMVPVHAALAIRKGAFVKHGQARSLSQGQGNLSANADVPGRAARHARPTVSRGTLHLPSSVTVPMSLRVQMTSGTSEPRNPRRGGGTWNLGMNSKK